MPLVRLENATLAFGEVPILDKINLQIDAREKIFLIGRNGMGKSCLLKVIMGHYKLDDGKVHIEPGLKIAELGQDLPNCDTTTVYDYVAQGLEGLGDLLKRYHELTSPNITTHDQVWMNEIEEVQRQLELKDGWQYEQIIETVLTRLDLKADQHLGTLSGGWKRRAALAKALVSKPDLLLLDEPTNHLDLAAIEWLEEYLAEYSGALLCITHDRTLLSKLSKRILELDRGNIVSWSGDFASFMEDKEHRLEVEANHNKQFDKVLAREEAWIRQGVKARRTRNEGRVRALEQLRRERSQRRMLQGKPKFSSNQDNSSGDLVVNAEHVNFKYHERYMVKDFTNRIYKGDKIALVGPNGVGKSTLLKLLVGDLTPQSGTLKLGTRLQIAYFDQMRAGINFEESAIDNVAGGRESISVNGKDKHIISYLGDFLFTPDRVRIPVRMLSGGECNRLLLAKMFSLPSNLLVLDEPTNDLDIESLELLEELLLEYKGTILLVSHDRTFVDQVATSTLVFRGDGIIDDYVGGFKDIPIINNNIVSKVTEQVKSTEIIQEKTLQTSSQPLQALSAKMKKELEDLPNKIANLESDQLALHAEIAKPEFYATTKDAQNKTLKKLATVDAALELLYKRWEELEAIRKA
jgi:ATP-binding cassette subfamily F protein uup